ncbi:MAG: hypothetical protein K8I30_01510 [Anaerolineae bacterium]|nr:hypothetical protein [Anaerolineae bacterium]
MTPFTAQPGDSLHALQVRVRAHLAGLGGEGGHNGFLHKIIQEMGIEPEFEIRAYLTSPLLRFA